MGRMQAVIRRMGQRSKGVGIEGASSSVFKMANASESEGGGAVIVEIEAISFCFNRSTSRTGVFLTSC